jgi:tRNA A37 threonylcarbamoyladenosine dehydratase
MSDVPASPVLADDDPDLERRFGGLRRLYGPGGYARLRAARVAVVGLGGVGSWAVEALARCGVAELVLIDLDHVAESNVNRQVQAVGATLGQAKAVALAARVADIHPGCVVHVVEEWADDTNWPALLPGEVDAVIDACDQSRAKLALAAWALASGVAYVCCGAAGGKRHPEKIEIADLAEATHDPLLAGLRQRLRRDHAAPRQGRIGVRCVFSREAVEAPIAADAAGEGVDGADGACELPLAADTGGVRDNTLNCHGYGSTVMVTASVGLAAAADVVTQLLKKRR